MVGRSCEPSYQLAQSRLPLESLSASCRKWPHFPNQQISRSKKNWECRASTCSLSRNSPASSSCSCCSCSSSCSCCGATCVASQKNLHHLHHSTMVTSCALSNITKLANFSLTCHPNLNGNSTSSGPKSSFRTSPNWTRTPCLVL